MGLGIVLLAIQAAMLLSPFIYIYISYKILTSKAVNELIFSIITNTSKAIKISCETRTSKIATKSTIVLALLIYPATLLMQQYYLYQSCGRDNTVIYKTISDLNPEILFSTPDMAFNAKDIPIKVDRFEIGYMVPNGEVRGLIEECEKTNNKACKNIKISGSRYIFSVSHPQKESLTTPPFSEIKIIDRGKNEVIAIAREYVDYTYLAYFKSLIQGSASERLACGYAGKTAGPWRSHDIKLTRAQEYIDADAKFIKSVFIKI